jgi:hypothetical protein
MSRTCGAPVPEAHDGCGKPGSHHERRSQSGQRGQGLDQPAAGTRDVARPDRVDRGHQQDGQRRHDNGGTKTSFGDLSSAVSSAMMDATRATAPPRMATPVLVSPGRAFERTSRPCGSGGGWLGDVTTSGRSVRSGVDTPHTVRRHRRSVAHLAALRSWVSG